MGQGTGTKSKEGIREDTAKPKISKQNMLLISGAILAIGMVVLLIVGAITSTPASNPHISVYRPQLDYEQPTPQQVAPSGSYPICGDGKCETGDCPQDCNGVAPVDMATFFNVSNPDGSTNWVFIAMIVVAVLVFLKPFGRRRWL